MAVRFNSDDRALARWWFSSTIAEHQVEQGAPFLRKGGHCLRLQDSLARRLPSLDSGDLAACEAHGQSLGAGHYERLEAELLLALARGDAGPRPPALAALEGVLGPNSPRLTQLRALVR